MPKIPNWYKLKHEVKLKYDLMDLFFVRKNGQIFNYLPQSQDNLSLWGDMLSTPDDRTGINTLSTVGSPKSVTYPFCEITNVLPLNGTSQYAISNNNAATSMEDNKAFTLSTWFNADTTAAGALISKRNGSFTGQYQIRLDGSSAIDFMLFDASLGHILTATSNQTYLASTWNHVVCTYSGTGTTSSDIKMYLNGESLDLTIVPNSFEKIRANGSNVEFGVSNDGSYGAWFDGSLAEPAIWQNRVLEEQEVKAIYNGVLSCAYRPMSGFITNPPRYNIRQWDAATGSYPTIARTGDVSRLGNYKTQFNDTDVVIFEDPYAKASVNFDMKFNTKIIPSSAVTSEIFVSIVNSPLGSDNFIEVISPTVSEDFLSPRENDSIRLIDSDGTTVDFVFKSKPVGDAQVALPANKYDRFKLALNFTNKVNNYPGLNIYASIDAEAKQKRLADREVLANGTVSLKQQTAGSAGNTTITSAMVLPPFFATPEGIVVSSAFAGGKDINVNYPTLLQSGVPQKMLKQAYVSPNILDNNLDNSGGIVRSGISDSHLRFTPGEDLTAFNDSRIDLRTNAFFNEGTPEDVYPGFSYPLKSKTQIEITLPNSTEEYLVKNVKARSDLVDASGYFAGKNKTGFLYYNFKTSRWDQIGLKDPASGNNITFDWAMELDQSSVIPANKIVSGTNNYPQQFYPPRTETTATANSSALRKTFAYQSVGLPIVNSFAPWGTKYHATSSQCLNMSDFIASPFLLEKMTVEVPYIARRTNDGTGTQNSQEKWLDRQQMLNFTFFAYKQQSHTPPGIKVDSHLDVTGSTRELIITGGMCFYNNQFTGNTGTVFTEFAPEHTPAFKYNFNQRAATVPYTVVVTGSAFLELVPGLANAQIVGFSRIPSSSVSYNTDLDDTAPKTITTSNPAITNYWPGGLTFKDFGEIVYTGKSGSYEAYGGQNQKLMSANQTMGKLTGAGFDITSFKTAFSNTVDMKVNASRPIRGTIGGEIIKLRTGNDVILEGQRVVESPYLLFPEDELVFGWDTGVGIGREMRCINELTGSYMKLRTDTPIKITMYGSQIKDKVEFHDTLNQPLTSDAIHEAIHYDNPVLDQYQIEPRTSYIGSYLDDYNGDIPIRLSSNPASRIGREISGLINSPSTSLEGTPGFTRFTQVFNLAEVFYDSLLPDVSPFIKESCDTIADNTFNVVLSDYNNSASPSILSYPFSIKSGGKPTAFKPKLSYHIVNKQFWYVGTLGGSQHHIPFGWRLPAAGAGSNARATFVSVADPGWAKEHGLPAPCRYDDSTWGIGNLSYTYEIFDTNSILKSGKIIYPYVGNPLRMNTNNDSLVLLVSQLTEVRMRKPTSQFSVNSNGQFSDLPGDVDKLIAVTDPQCEYLEGAGIATSLFGGSSRNQTGQYFVTNNKQNVLATHNGIYAKDQPMSDITDVYNTHLSNFTATIKNVTLTGSLSLGTSQLSYGLINAGKQNNKSYFRSDRYTGQVADIIHTGHDTAFSSLIMKAPIFSYDKPGINKDRQSASPAVVVSFVSGANTSPSQNLGMRRFTRILPDQITLEQRAQSSNLSIYATSSMPYVDDENTYNRPYLDPTISV